MKKINILNFFLVLLFLGSFPVSGQDFVSSIAKADASYIRIQEADEVKNFLKDAGSQTLTVETNLALYAKSDKTWCTPTVSEKVVTIAVAQSNEEESRTAEVKIYGKDNKSALVRVIQLGTKPDILVNETSFELDQYTTGFSIGIASSVVFTFELPAWVKGPSVAPAIGFNTYEFTVDPITTAGEKREGEITIKTADNSVSEIKIPVAQTHVGFPRFAVISDIHFENNSGEGAKVKVPKALKNIVAKGVDAIFIVGDLTDYCRESDWQAFEKVFSDNTIVPVDLPVYFMMGNHDFYTHNRTGCEEMYQKYTNQDLHQYIEIKGYPFITLSMSGTSASSYSMECLEFLKTSLEDAEEKFPGKPIFVFSHVPPKNTVYGSSASDGWGTDVYESIIKNYPQIIFFSGHSHFPLGDPRSIYQNLYTSVNDGSTTYSEIESGTVNAGIHPEKYQYVTEGVIVNVDGDKNVELERWDTYRDEELAPRWYVNAPHDGSAFLYKGKTDQIAPKFAYGEKPIISEIAEESCKVTFNQAIDNEVVHHYIIELVRGTSVVSTFKKFSEFYLNSEMPSSFTIRLNGVPTGATLTAKVTAVDSYNNKSTPIVSDEFTTGAYEPGEGTTKPDASTLLLDVNFKQNGAVEDASSLNNPISVGSTVPETYFNDTYNRWVAKFTGDNTRYYKMDYTNNQTIKDAFSGGFTFEVIYMSNTTGNVAPMSAQESGGAGIEQASGGQIQFWAHIGGGYKTVSSSVSITTGNYYHVVAVYDKNAGKTLIYVDGSPAGELAVSGNFAFPSNTAAHWIGIGGDAGTGSVVQFSLNGEVVLARMYNKAVTRDEVYWMYKEVSD